MFSQSLLTEYILSGAESITNNRFQFPLLGFLLCIGYSAAGCRRHSFVLSIPFIGIFALHQWSTSDYASHATTTFNSLYWDFCFASMMKTTGVHYGAVLSIPFIGIFALHRDFWSMGLTVLESTFNSLYWDFCFASMLIQLFVPNLSENLSIPFIGIFALHRNIPLQARSHYGNLSIPFIGIFALHPFTNNSGSTITVNFQFPLLGFLLCIEIANGYL